MGLTFLNALWAYLLISAPYLLIGFVISGLIKSFITDAQIQKWMGGRGLGSVIKAAIIGIPIPLCSCAVIPTAATLRKSGASNEATASFLIATPETGIDSIAMTYALMDLPMTIVRVICAFFSAIFAGVLNFLFNDHQLSTKLEDKKHCCSKHRGSGLTVKLKNGLVFAFHDLINDLSFWLSVGILVGAGITLFVPEDLFLKLGPHANRFIILLIGVPLYICASATTPVAASLMLKGMDPGAALLLLMVGPATNISNIVVLKKYIGKKGIILNIISVVLVSVLFSYLIDGIYQWIGQSPKVKLGELHTEEGASIFSNLCAALLSLLLIKGLYFEKIKPLFKSKA